LRDSLAKYLHFYNRKKHLQTKYSIEHNELGMGDKETKVNFARVEKASVERCRDIVCSFASFAPLFLSAMWVGWGVVDLRNIFFFFFFFLIVFDGTEVPIVYILLCRPSEDSLQ
jgi:hypothetical protein